MKHGLEPVIWPESRVLILGSLPGDESLQVRQYYANPDNQIWTILALVYGESPGATYSSRLAFLRDRRLALWDVLRSAGRTGSLDQDIENEVVNNFSDFPTRYPALRAIAFNGTKAEDLFRRYVVGRGGTEMLRSRQLITLPSTSPTPGRHVLPFEQKVEKWKIIATV
ncbi:MAG: DNA-deoxyinosine glycosylase [Anaerolineales bacterium]